MKLKEMINSFIDCLKKDTIPWHRSWSAKQRPFNAVTNTTYRGVNSLWLSYNQFAREFDDPRWCTFKQAQTQGWKIKPGSKGTRVEFWSLYDTEEKRKLTQREAKQLSDELTREEFKNRVKPISNVYTVFNGEQIDGIPKYEEKTYELNTEELLQKRDTLLKNMNVDFSEGGDKAFYNPSRDRITLPEMNRFETEYDYMATLLHEAGHAIVSSMLETQKEIKEVSIIPRGVAGGYTMYKTNEDKYYISKTEMEEKLVALLGGRAAEKIALNDISTGASNDIEVATEIAKNMIVKYGMSENLGPISINTERDPYELQMLGERFGDAIGAEVKVLLDTAYTRAQSLIINNMDKLNKVAEALLEKEVISAEEFQELIK